MGEPAVPQPARAAGAAAVVGDRIVVFGGQADGRLLDTTEVFDGKQWSAGANIPTPREHLAAASDGHFAYAVGGRRMSSDKNVAALERYDPATDRWERLPGMPTARGGLGAALVDGHLLAVGGESATGVFGVVESYNVADKSWSRGPSMRSPRHGWPWPRSAARSMRSAAPPSPATRARSRLRRFSSAPVGSIAPIAHADR